MIRLAVLLFLALGVLRADAQGLVPIPTPCGSVAVGPNFPFLICPTIDMDFVDGLYFGAGVSNLTVSNSGGTNLLPTSPLGYAYTTFGANTPRITPGYGLLVEEARSNALLNSTAPATQTTGSLSTGTYTLWVNGSGSATMSSGSGGGCGSSTATQNNSISFTITSLGTCTVTVSGSLNAFQLELNPGSVALGTSLIITGGSPVTRTFDAISLAAGFGTGLSLYASGVPFASGAYGNSQIIVQPVNSGNTGNRVALFRQAATGYAFQAVAGGTETLGNGTIVWGTGSPSKIGFAFGGSSSINFNGANIANVSSGEVLPTGLNTVWLGQQFNQGLAWNGYIMRVAIWSSVLTTAQLQNITIGNGP